VKATQAICQEQQLPHALPAIEAAAKAQLAGEPAPPLTLPFSWGWRRPTLPPHAKQRPPLTERFLRWLGQSPYGFVRPMVPAGAWLGILAGFIPFIHATWAQTLLFCGGFAGALMVWFASDIWAHVYVEKHYAPRKEARVSDSELHRWARLMPCRRYVQACLFSAIPYLLEGDVTQLKALESQHEEKEKAQRQQEAQQRHEAERVDRIARLRKMFND
jgi:hypothetical protein